MAPNPQLEGPAGRRPWHAVTNQDGVPSKPSWGVRSPLLVLRFVEYRLQQHSFNDANPFFRRWPTSPYDVGKALISALLAATFAWTGRPSSFR
jgi:hypothetical protein